MVDATVRGAEHGAEIELRPGGAAFNTAAWAVELGAAATVVARVGDDFAGRALAGALARAGIEAELTVDPSARTGTFAVVDGMLRVDRGANAGAWEPRALPAADATFVSGYLAPETVSRVVARIRAPVLAVGAGRLAQVPAKAGIVLANADEARSLTGEADPAEAARQLAAAVRIACVTLGAEGAVAADGCGVVRARPPGRHPEPARGAGDAFAAAFVLALAGGASVAEALDAGCALGARSAAAHSPSPGFAM